MRDGFRVGDFYLERLLVDPGHEFRIECALAAGAVDSADSESDLPLTTDDYFPSPALPEEKLDQPLDVRHVGRRIRGIGPEDLGLVCGDNSVRPLDSDPHRLAALLLDAVSESAVYDNSGKESGVKRGDELCGVHGNGD